MSRRKRILHDNNAVYRKVRAVQQLKKRKLRKLKFNDRSKHEVK